MVMELGIVVLRVRDWYRAVDWYRDVLGLTELYREEATQWAEFEVGPVHLAVEAIAAPGEPHDSLGDGFTLEFRVPDLEATVSDLASRGVVFTTDVTEKEWGRIVTCVDVEGNEIQIYQES